LRFYTNGNNERVRITSSGKIGIGEDDPESNHVLIRGSSTVGTKNGHIMLTGDSATVGEGPQIVFSESGSGANWAGAYIGHIRQGGGSVGDLVFGTRGTSGDANTVPTERLRIDSSGRLLLGTTSVGSASAYYDNLIISNTTSAEGSGITLFAATNGFNAIDFADTAAVGRGRITYAHSDDRMMFDVGGNERARITSSGDFGIGTTSPDRKLDVSGNGNVYGKFQSTDSTGAGIEVKDTSENWLIQADGGGANSLAFYDLANTSYRVHMKSNGNVEIVNGDLKVAAGHGIDFSAQSTTSQSNTSVQAELLNHYEEGTWTPRISSTSGAGTVTHTQQHGRYTRIGNVVHAYFKVEWNSGSGSGDLILHDFPFTCASSAGNEATGAAMFYNVNLRDNAMHTITYLGNGVSYAYFYSSRDAAAWYSTLFDAAGAIISSVTYRVD